MAAEKQLRQVDKEVYNKAQVMPILYTTLYTSTGQKSLYPPGNHYADGYDLETGHFLEVVTWWIVAFLCSATTYESHHSWPWDSQVLNDY